MKPVEIEILMRDGLTPGLSNARRVVRQFSEDAKIELNEVTASLNEQKKHIKRLEKEVASLEKAFKKAAPGQEWQTAKSRLEAARQELEEEKSALDGLIQKQNELKGAAEGADTSLRQQLRNLTQEIATLMVSYAQLSDEERASAEGKALQRHIEELTEQAGILRDAMADTTAAINNAASDTRGFDQMAGALQLVIDGFGLATAGAEIFGVSQEDLVEAQTKLQAALVASNALSSMQNTLQKQSALMQGVNIIQTKALATAENIKTAAQGRGVIVTKAATIAQAAFNAVAKANPYVILAMACLTVVGALYAFAKGSKAAQKAEEERQAQAEKRKQQEEDFARAVVESAGSQIASFLKLKRAWENLGDSLDKKKKFITDTKDEWRKLGKEIDNVNDMEKIFRQHTKDMLNAIIKRAELKAYETRIQQVADDMVSEVEKNKTFRYKTVHAGALSGTGQGFGVSGHTDFQTLTPEEVAAARAVGGITSWHSQYGGQSGTDLTEEGARVINEMRRKAGNQAALERQEAARQNAIQRISGYVDTMTQLSGELEHTMANIPGIDVEPDGGTPDKPDKPNKPGEDDRIEQERRVAEELRKLRWKNEQEAIDQMEEGADKRRRQIKLDYKKQIAEIQAQEAKWREAQNGILTPEQDEALRQSYALAQSGMESSVRQVENDEVAKSREKLNELLQQYKDFDQRRRDIDTAYNADMEVLNAELNRLRGEGADTTEIESAISARTQAYQNSIRTLEGEILQSSDFYDKLFGTVSDRGYKVLKDFYAQAQETLENAKVDGDGVEISIPVKDADGKFVKKAVKITVDEYRRMLKQVQEIRKQLEKDNPFAAFRTSWSELNKAIKENGDVTGALKSLQSKGKEVTSTIRGWGDALGSVFGDNFKNSMNEIMTFCDGAMDMGTGIAQIWSGDIVGGITNTLNGLSSIFSLFSSWKEKMEEMKREWYIAEIETNRAIRERTVEYAANQSQISDIIKDVELLNWLIDRGYAKPASVSVWEAQSSALDEYTKNLRSETAAWDDLWNRLQGSQGHYEWGNSLNGGSATWDLRGYSAQQIELWYNQNKLSNEARAYYEAWVASGKTIEELKQNIEECYNSMREMVMGVSFDSFLSNAKDALKAMRGDVSKLGEFTEDTLANAILNGFMYKDLAKVLEPLYNELSEHLIAGTADKAYLENWKLRFEQAMSAANDRLDGIADAAGIDLDTAGSSQSGKSGTYTAMSQDQGTKLEGIGTSIQMHSASIDENVENVSDKMNVATEHLRKIEENTSATAKETKEINEKLEQIIRDGIKI